ncbi:MAG: aspartate kinase [Lachnospiraceae bacterium]|nr:aspartate kinase [Lachnospiraceae bacterium]MBR1522940.1 aspartate kinase [Lachnospiraceae bacterium]
MKKVVKFGGSSLSGADQFIKVKEIIDLDKARRYVVPSAPGKRDGKDTKVTDLLYEAYALASRDKDFSRVFKKIEDRYNSIIEGLGLEISLADEFRTIKKNFKQKTGEDYAASRGEYLNGLLLADYLKYTFVDAAEVVFFDDDGNFDSAKTYKVMHERLEDVERAVIPGFYGSYSDGRIKTFSRGGSDITGSIVARSVKADVYENWTDVSGFFVADPRIITDPETIEMITYTELRELAYMGASVLHEDAIFPVRREGIPINIRNTNKPEDKGSWIVQSTGQKSKFIITGITGKKGFCSVNIEKDKMNSEVGFGRRVLQAFEDNDISFEHMPSGIDTMTIIVHQDEFMEKEQSVVSEINRLTHPDSIDIESDLALIAVVGRGMKSSKGTSGRIFSALAHANVNVKMIDQGSSELNIIIGVKNEDFENAIRAIYNIFVLARL